MAEHVELLKKAKKETAKLFAMVAIMFASVAIFVAIWNRIELSKRSALYPRLIELIEIHKKDKLVTRKDIEELAELNNWDVPGNLPKEKR